MEGAGRTRRRRVGVCGPGTVRECVRKVTHGRKRSTFCGGLRKVLLTTTTMGTYGQETHSECARAMEIV